MNNLIIREGRVLLQQPIQKQQLLTLKLGIGTKIYKFSHLIWNVFCRRWETTQELKVACSPHAPIQFELYYHKNGLPQVLGEGAIDMALVRGHLNQQFKIALSYDGIMSGWLYCMLVVESEVQKKIDYKFLCIYKISFSFLADEEQSFTMQIFQNASPIFQKQFTVVKKAKSIFPNLKQPIRYSDVITLTLLHAKNKKEFKSISFLADHVKRGKTTYFQSWLRNKHNNRTGDLKLQYFLQNLFLQNERKLVSRKGLYNAYNATYYAEEKILKKSDLVNVQDTLAKPVSKENLLHMKNNQKNEQEGQLPIMNKRADEKQTCKMKKQCQKRGSKRSPKEHYTQQPKQSQSSIAGLRPSKTNFTVSKPKAAQKADKKQFYFQNPIQL